jgi:hypothetical protein
MLIKELLLLLLFKPIFYLNFFTLFTPSNNFDFILEILLTIFISFLLAIENGLYTYIW